MGDKLTCVYSSNAAQIGQTVTVESRNGKALNVSVPKGGFVVFK
jgi:hypothetical protein